MRLGIVMSLSSTADDRLDWRYIVEPSMINTREFLSNVCAVTEQHRFIGCYLAKRNTGLSSTAFRTMDNMFPYEHSPQETIPVTTEHRKLATRIIKWASKYYKELAEKEFSGFTRDVNIALDGAEFSIRYKGQVAYMYWAYMKENEAKKTMAL